MQEIMQEALVEQIELKEAVAELRKLENELKNTSANISSTLVTTWCEMGNFDSGGERNKINFERIDTLTNKTTEIYNSLVALRERIYAGLTKNETESEFAEAAADKLPELITDLINEAGELRMHLSTAASYLGRALCPARIIRARIAKLLQIPRVSTDDLILSNKSFQNGQEEDDDREDFEIIGSDV